MPRPTDAPKGVTEGEDRLLRALVHQLRDVHPPQHAAPAHPPNGASKLQVITIVVAILSPLITLFGGGYFMTSYWRGEDARRDTIEAIQKEQEASRKERTDNRAIATRALEKAQELDTRTSDYPVVRGDVKRQEGEQQRIAKNLDDGRAERQRQIDDARNKQGETEKGLALIVQRQDSLERKIDMVLERMEARGRGEADRPFRENRSEDDRRFPFSLRASLIAPEKPVGEARILSGY